jgi:Protein of unknown function (DUF3102)
MGQELATRPAELTLDALAAEANQAHEACESSYAGALAHALRCGEVLAEAKSRLAHGEWLPWLDVNFNGAGRTAQRYMQIADAPEANASSTTHLETIEAVLTVVSTARPSEPEPPRQDIGAALRDLGSTEGAGETLGEGPGQQSFPAAGMEQRTWREIRGALARVERAMENARAEGLSGWGRAEYLDKASSASSQAAALLEELGRAIR